MMLVRATQTLGRAAAVGRQTWTSSARSGLGTAGRSTAGRRWASAVAAASSGAGREERTRREQANVWRTLAAVGAASAAGALLTTLLGDERTAAAADGKESHEPAIFRLVLTGGPCGGKTSALNRLTDLLRAQGWDIYMVPEVPTIMFLGGCVYPGMANTEQLLEFETALIKLQLQMEDTFIQVARSTGRRSIIIFDRGACDVAAYLPPEIWTALLQANGWTQQQLFDRYDCVMHLVTAADGAESFYTRANNAARSETPERARELDQRVLQAWANHRSHRVIDNSTTFDGKLKRTCDALTEVLPQ